MDSFEKAFLDDLNCSDDDTLIEMFASQFFYSEQEIEMIKNELKKRNISTDDIELQQDDDMQFSEEIESLYEDEIIEDVNPGLEEPVDGAVYSVNGVRGRHIDIYDNKCIITTKVTIGSLLTHNATDGSKTIYYSDVVGVQFKEPGFTIGYLQLETPGLTMNNAASNFFNENSFTFDTTVISTEKMREIAAYVEKRVYEIKHPKQETTPAAVQAPFSVADELLKFKQLLDMGVLTQEEFDTKKKELLGL